MKQPKNCPRLFQTVGWYLALFALPLTVSVFPQQREEPLTLASAIQTALSRNEISLIADQQLRAANARLARARAYFFPAVSLNGTLTRRPFEVKREFNGQQITIQSLNAIAGNISLNWILFDSTVIPGVQQAHNEQNAERQNAIESKRRLSFEAASAFLMTVTVDQMVEAAQRRLVLAQRTLEASRTRFEAGLVSVNDVTRTELELASAEKTLTELSGEAETARLQLGYLLGIPVKSPLVFPEWLIQSTRNRSSLETETNEAAKGRRPDLNALRFQLKAVKSLGLETILRWFPTLAFTGQYRYTNEAGLTGRSTNWNLGLSMSWPIFDGMRRLTDSRERSALVKIAELNLQSALRRSDLEIQDARISLDNQRATMKQAELAHEVATKNAAETVELYNQGLTGVLYLADANIRLFEAEVGVAQVRVGLAIAYLNLRAALGYDPIAMEKKQ